jgi:phosphatidate cytidylyltransferase
MLIVYAGGPYLLALLAGLSVIGMRELFAALSPGKRQNVHIAAYAFALIYYLSLFLGSGERYVFPAFVLTLLALLVARHAEIGVTDVSASLFAFFYAPYLMSHVWLAREAREGRWFVWLIFICAWAADTGAYFVGVKFGKRKLTPLSPNKTIEGAAGGVLSAAALAGAYGAALYFTGKETEFSPFFAGVGALGSIVSQIGDLAASAIKRRTGIKDFGSLLPGHGGVIDRFDSVLFTAPAVYLMMRCLFNAG